MRAPVVAAALGLLLSLGPAPLGRCAGADREGVQLPERLTAGAADQLLGQLAADGRRLYYASNQGALSQIFVQEWSGAARPLFDDAADATWPRLSPDGAQLLYIGHHADAAGDLCLRDVATLQRRCLEDPAHADLQAVWMPDGRSALLLSREGLHGDLLLRRVWLQPALRAEPYLRENLSGPAVSPDGRWLVYVPVRRMGRSVGVGFAAQAADELVLVRLGARGPEGAPRRLRFDLPGEGGQPAFSLDGRFLYFTRYLNDTNLDGVADGNDHGVLFRVPFDGAAADPVPAQALGAPLQLTSAAWNCQYPTPARERLVATCAIHGSLDVYALPLDGSVPAAWGEAKLRDELRSSQDRWERLLLQSRLLLLLRGPARTAQLFEMARQHLALREYQSASFYAARIARLGGTHGALGEILGELAAHRREERVLDRGQLGARFVARAEERIAALGRRREGAGPDVAALAALGQGEILDTLGRKGEALARLRLVRPAELSEPMVLHLYGERAREQLRPLGDRGALLEALRALATHPGLPAAERLLYGAAFIRELSRGRGVAAIRGELGAQQAQVEPASDLAFLLELEGWLLQLAPGQEEPVRAGVFALYRKHKDPDRRRALIAATVGRAAALDSDFVTYQFANTWVSGLTRDQAERRYAEQLFRQVVLERAYVQWQGARVGDARGNFFGVTLQTDSLEGHVGFIEARLREGQRDVAEQYARRFAGKADEPVHLFVRAYLIARDLPAEAAAFARAAAEATDLLGRAAARLPGRVEIEHLWGYLAHQRYLRSGDTGAAREATTHYLLALDLARDNVRYRAAVLEQLGLLQGAVGNVRAAIGYLEERGKLPFVEPRAELRHLLALARSRFRAERAEEAAAAAEQALALVEQHADLGPFRPLALDRAGLYHLAAGAHARAYARLAALTPLLAPAPGRDQLVHRLARAAAALGAGRAGEALADLGEAERLLGQREVAQALRRPREDLSETLGSLRLVLLGLRAQAQRALGQAGDAERSLAARRDLLVSRLGRRALDEDLLELARTEAGLAGLRLRLRDLGGAARHLEAGLRHAQAWEERTGTPVHEVGLGLLLGRADLHLFGGAAMPPGELERRLAAAHRKLGPLRSPRWAAARERLALQRTLIRLGSGAGQGGASPHRGGDSR